MDQRGEKKPVVLWHGGVLGLLGGLGLALAAWGQGAADSDSPVVPLNDLLKLPATLVVPGHLERHGGATKAEWQARFVTAREDIAKAKKNLAKSRKALEKKAGESGAWKMSAPGMGDTNPQDRNPQINPNAPSDYKLSQQLRREREELDRSERYLQDLQVEANLAGVPEGWRYFEAPVARSEAPVAR